MKTRHEVDTKRADAEGRSSAKPCDTNLRDVASHADKVRSALDMLGFLPGETVQIATRDTGEFKRRAVHVADLDGDVLRPQRDLWIGANPIRPKGRGYTKGRVAQIRNIAADVDYDVPGHHKKKPPHADLGAALAAIAALPRPTFIQHTGGGIQTFWCIAPPLQNDKAGRLRAETLGRKFEAAAKADSCHSVDHVFRFPYSLNCKTNPPKPVELQDYSGVAYTVEELEAAAAGLSVATATRTVTVGPAKGGEDRSALAFGIVKMMDDAGITDERRFLAELKKSAAWNHYSDDDHARRDIRAIRKKLSDARERIEPATEVVLDSIDDMVVSAKLRMMAERFQSKFHRPNEYFDRVLAVLEQCHLGGQKCMIPARCGQGKTTAMVVLAAAYASPINRFLLVVEKIDDVTQIAARLSSLGVEPTAWHGHPGQPTCPHDRKEFLRLKKERLLPCQACRKPCAAKRKYESSDPFCPPGPVVVTTHAWFRAMAGKGTLSRFQQLIIDEEPAVFEHFEFTDRDACHLLRCLPPDTQDDCRQWLQEVEAALADGGGRRIPTYKGTESVDIGETAQAHLAMLVNKGEASDEDCALVSSFIQFVQSQRHGQSYGFMEYETAKGSSERVKWLIAKSLDFGALPPTMVLNGSADLSFVRWEGFRIVDQSSFRTTYPNTKVRVTMGNPSQRNLASKDFFRELQESVLDAVEQTNTESVIIFANKDLHRKRQGIDQNISALRSVLQQRGVELLDLTYGQHRATNDGQDKSGVVICMGLFRKLGWYVVRACAATDSEIGPERIWAEKWESPKMRKGGGFADAAIQRIYTLTVTYDVEQAILRGRIRKDPNLPYLACIVASGLDVISLLEDKFPGATSEYDDKWLVERFRSGHAVDAIAAVIVVESVLVCFGRQDDLSVVGRVLLVLASCLGEEPDQVLPRHPGLLSGQDVEADPVGA